MTKEVDAKLLALMKYAKAHESVVAKAHVGYSDDYNPDACTIGYEDANDVLAEAIRKIRYTLDMVGAYNEVKQIAKEVGYRDWPSFRISYQTTTGETKMETLQASCEEEAINALKEHNSDFKSVNYVMSEK
jgi:hypothetical protein